MGDWPCSGRSLCSRVFIPVTVAPSPHDETNVLWKHDNPYLNAKLNVAARDDCGIKCLSQPPSGSGTVEG